MTDVGQELQTRAVEMLQPGVDPLQLSCACLDLRFEIALGRHEAVLLVFQLVCHLVEPAREHGELISSGRKDAVLQAPLSDRSRSFHQAADRGGKRTAQEQGRAEADDQAQRGGGGQRERQSPRQVCGGRFRLRHFVTFAGDRLGQQALQVRAEAALDLGAEDAERLDAPRRGVAQEQAFGGTVDLAVEAAEELELLEFLGFLCHVRFLPALEKGQFGPCHAFELREVHFDVAARRRELGHLSLA
jgi:hypothetical protein